MTVSKLKDSEAQMCYKLRHSTVNMDIYFFDEQIFDLEPSTGLPIKCYADFFSNIKICGRKCCGQSGNFRKNSLKKPSYLVTRCRKDHQVYQTTSQRGVQV